MNKDHNDPDINAEVSHTTTVLDTLPKNSKKSPRLQAFYGDPGAQEGFNQIDKFAMDLFAATIDPNHIMLKTIGKLEIVKMIDRYMTHVEFRARMDWARERHYELGSGVSQGPTLNMNFGEAQIPVYE